MVKLKELNLLLVEDNLEFAQNTIETLKIYFKEVIHSKNIKDALSTFSNSRIDIIISDIKVADGNGLDFIKAIRESNNDIPIIILSAHKDEEFLFKAIGLNILSYELKPLSYKKLNKLLNTISQKFNNKKEVYINEDTLYNYTTKELYENNQAINLTKREVLFIELLIKNSDAIVTNEIIQRDIYEDKIMSESALKNMIFRLRKKVSKEFITTVTNVGYKLSHTL
ncbi:response regulator transcription factor [Sulfurimonas sp.]